MHKPYHEHEHNDMAAQQVARDAVVGMRLFPDFTVALRRSLGYGPHVDMLQHFVYWFHPRHPKMQERWTLYKTYREWHDECGLTDRQVKKGRKILRELGLVTEKKGPYGRVHYRVDWVALAKALSLDGISDQTDDFDELFEDDEDEFSLDGISDQPQIGRYSDQSSLDGISVRPNTGEDAGEYEQENTLLQRAAEPATAEPAAPEININFQNQEHLEAQAGGDKRHSQDIETPSETTTAREGVIPTQPKKLTPVEVSELVNFVLADKNGREIALRHLRDETSVWTLEEIAIYVCRHLDKPEADYAERYLARLPEALEELHLETATDKVEVA